MAVNESLSSLRDDIDHFFFQSIQEHSDARLRRMNEILQGMRLIKLRAWEKLFSDKIGETRNQELKLLDKDSFYWALISEFIN